MHQISDFHSHCTQRERLVKPREKMGENAGRTGMKAASACLHFLCRFFVTENRSNLNGNNRRRCDENGERERSQICRLPFHGYPW